jgi:hypothetical protein
MRFFACVYFLLAALPSTVCLAGPHYLFRGHFAPTDRVASPELAPVAPGLPMGIPFTARVKWSGDSGNYAGDIQMGADYWGEYRTEAIEIDFDVPGFDFSIPPVIYSWETWNDTVLDYDYGAPVRLGDELRLVGRADWKVLVDMGMPADGPPPEPRPYFLFDYLLTLRMIDESGGQVADQSLQLDFDPRTFGEVRFELQQLVPVSGGDPRPIYFEHWLGVVDEIVAVPEPAVGIMLAAVVAGLATRGHARRGTA